ncbi:TPA: 50S ribosomal protein L1 [Candidatus Micrarchaeota archaeon]|nr:50S ribosomal protein L1 [Candidatus Micrarchaeota archaeon]
MVKEEAILEAVKEVIKNKRNFVQSVDLIVVIDGLDLKKPENRITLSVELPAKLSKPRSVAVIGTGAFLEKAKEAKPDALISNEDLKKLAADRKKAKKLGKAYDFFVCEASLMPDVGRVLGFVLGPRRRMPTPIPPSGDVAASIRKFKNSVHIFLKNQPVAATSIGYQDMAPGDLAKNAAEVIRAISERLPRGAAIKRIYVKTTMGPPVEVPVK